MARVTVGPADGIPPGTMKGFRVNDRRFVVVNLDGRFHALDGVCTHAYFELEKGFFAGRYVTCSLHLSQFDVETGEPISPPATDPLPKYPVVVEDGTVYVDVPD